MKNFHYIPNLNRLIRFTLFLFTLTLYSCSPTATILKYQPNIAGNILEKKVIKIIQNNQTGSDVQNVVKDIETIVSYSFGFILEEADRQRLINYENAVLLENQANYNFKYAVKIGDSILGDEYNWDKSIPYKNSQNIDISLLYWLAAAYGGAVSTSGGDPEWLIKLPRVGKLLRDITLVDSTWNSGAAYSALITYSMNNPMLTLKEKESYARYCFDKAVILSDNLDASIYLSLAENISILNQNREEFQNLIFKSLEISNFNNNNYRLSNIISHKRAIWLLENIDEFFY